MTVTISLHSGSSLEYKNVSHVTTSQGSTILSSKNSTIASITNDSFK